MATGAAFRTRYLREVMKDDKYDQVSVAFFGDGTSNHGAFYESLNMASLYKLPVIFVIENNLWAIGMNHWRATAPSFGDSKPHIYKKGEPFGMPGVLVDGMDVLKVREVALEAIARARRGDGPTVIEAETYRFRGHSLADPDELRSKEEKEYFAAKDPIPQLEKHLLDNKLCSAEDLAAVRKAVDAKVDEAVEFAEASPSPERKQLLENVFPDPKGFGIAANGKYQYEDPRFSEGALLWWAFAAGLRVSDPACALPCSRRHGQRVRGLGGDRIHVDKRGAAILPPRFTTMPHVGALGQRQVPQSLAVSARGGCACAHYAQQHVPRATRRAGASATRKEARRYTFQSGAPAPGRLAAPACGACARRRCWPLLRSPALRTSTTRATTTTPTASWQRRVRALRSTPVPRTRACRQAAHVTASAPPAWRLGCFQSL